MLEATAAELRQAFCAWASAFDPDLLDPGDAARLVTECAAVEHAAATVKAMAAARVPASAVRAAGAKDTAEWLARKDGTTTAAALEAVRTAERMATLPEVAAAARAGELSPAKAAAIADAAAVDPDAEAGLLAAARRGESLGELRDRCARVKAAADPDPDATRERIRRSRCLKRYGTPDGVEHLHASGPRLDLARIDAALRPFLERRFAQARQTGEHEPYEAYLFDALVALADAHGATGARPPDRVTVRVDLDALVRGHVEGDDICDIPGLGPLPVSEVRDLIGDASLQLVLTRGRAANVTHLGRGANAAQKLALLWQSPACMREGCARRARLENDHRTPFASQRETSLDNLDRLCHHDHQLKTTQGWALVRGTGRRPMVPPDHPDHPGCPATARPPP